MARHRIGDALLAVYKNQLDRRMNGVFEYDPSTDDEGEGEGAVTPGSGSTTVSSNSFDGQISGDRISFSQESVSLDGNDDPDEERIDVIGGSADGSVKAWKGQLAPLTTTEGENGESVTLEGRQNPRSQPPDMHGFEGVVLAAVRVPPGGEGITQDDIHDLRRPALDLAGDQSQNVLGIPYSSLDSGDHNRVGQAMILPPDSTLELVGWGLCWKDEWGQSSPESGHELRLLDADLAEIERTEEFWEGADGSADALFSVSNDDDEPLAYQFQLRNDSDEDFSWNEDERAMSALVYYRLV